MSWFDDFGSGANATTSTSPGTEGQNIYYDRNFLMTVENLLLLTSFGQRRPLPSDSGKVIKFFRWLKLSTSVSAATLTESVNPDATQAKGQDLIATIAEYGAFVQISSLQAQSHIDGNISKGLGKITSLLGEQAMTIIDTLTHQQVASNGCYPLPADYDSDAESTFATGVVDSATTTTVVDAILITNTNYGDANDDLNQSIIIMTSGDSYGQARVVTDYVQATGTITVSPAWDKTPVAGDTFVVATPDALAAGDDLSWANVKKARTLLATYRAKRFGKYWIGIINPDSASGLMDDTKWVDVHTYKDQTMGIFEAEVGKFGGVRFLEETNAFKFNIESRGNSGNNFGPGVDGAHFSETGAIISNLIFGRDAFGVTTFKTKTGQLKKPRIIIKSSGSQDTSNPLSRYGTAGWALEYVTKSLNPLHVVCVWTG